MEFSQQIKKYRSQAALTQDELAEKIYVTRQTISNWENEKSYPDIASVVKLSDLYSISLDELLKGDAKMLEHLEENTDVVNSSRKLILAAALNVVVLLACLIAAFSCRRASFSSSAYSAWRWRA